MGYTKNQMLADEFNQEISRNVAEENFWIYLNRDISRLGENAKKLKVKREFNKIYKDENLRIKTNAE